MHPYARILVSVALAATALLGAQPAGAEQIGSPEFPQLTSGGDFDGDGFVDAVISVAGEGIGGHPAAGLVHVLYGSPSGLSVQDTQSWWGGSEGLVGPGPGKRDGFGTRSVTADLNGDGFADLAVSAPDDKVDGSFSAGSVRVLYGGPDGLSTAGNQYLTEPGASSFVQFGRRLGAGDFDGDGIGDLAISNAPGFRAAAVYVLYGSPAGVGFDDSTTLTFARSDDQLVEVAAGDLDDDGDDDLVTASPGRAGGQGVIEIFLGGPDGIDPDSLQSLTQDSPGVPGIAAPEERFGERIALGDVESDGALDIAVVTLQDGRGEGAREQPSVTVLTGSVGQSLGGHGTRMRFRQLATKSAPQLGEFAAIDLGDVDGDGAADLAVGASLADVRNEVGELDGRVGAVILVPGSSSGPNLAARQAWSENTPGIPDYAEGDDDFGRAVSFGDVNGDGFQDLRLGVSGERVGWGDMDGGAVHVLHGSALGLVAAGASYWHQEIPGIPDHTESGDFFGAWIS